MKTEKVLLVITLLLIFSCAALADRELERAEILQVLQELTSQPKDAWLPAGVIEATHEEYRAPDTMDTNLINETIVQKIAEYENDQNKPEKTVNMRQKRLEATPFNVRYELSNEHTMTTTELIKYDGQRFYWEINLDSRTDSVKPGRDIEANFMTDEFNPTWNARRIFVWDGENYSTYFLPVNTATIDTTGEMPFSLSGPMTAGLNRWGYGYYSYDNLASLNSHVVEKLVDGQLQLHLTLDDTGGHQWEFVLDTAKDYAVLSCVITGYADTVIFKQYSDYRQVAGNWVPYDILLQKIEVGSNRLLNQDIWNITSIDPNLPGIESFAIDYVPDALIEYKSSITRKPVMYRKWHTVDGDNLLADRLVYAAAEGTQPQNCASAALKYAASQLGKDISDTQLAAMVAPDNQTSLLTIKQTAESAGLYCRAITCDIDTLSAVQDCQIILHIPGKKHFVVVDSIDTQYIRLIDLTSNRFFYRKDLHFFGMDWPDGTALLISKNPISGNFADIDQGRLAEITGAAYDCNYMKQGYNVIFCSEPIEGTCLGQQRIYSERWGCGYAESGSCSEETMERYRKSLCIEDPYDPLNCTVEGKWTIYYIQACE